MQRFRRNPSSEAKAFARDLAAGQITPAAVERRLRQLRDELDDAVYFRHHASEIQSLRALVTDLEDVLSGAAAAPEGPAARRERLEQEAFRYASEIESLNAQAAALARRIEGLERDLNESIRMRDPAHEIKRMRDEVAARLADHAALVIDLDAAQRRLTSMAESAQAELAQQPQVVVAPRDARAEADRQRASADLRQAKIRLASLQSEAKDPHIGRDFSRLQKVRRELREAEEDVAVLTARSLASNPPGRRSASRRHVTGVRRDLASGKLSMRDVSRRLDRYRRLLAETISDDPEAHERIVLLGGHIDDLESLIRRGGI